jgi:23S rRNA-/tRNA-specific pseudouridylate synthase
VVVDKAPHEPTAPQGEHQGSLLGRVRLLPGCGAAVPVQRLDAGTSGVSVFAKRAQAAAAWAAALGAPGAVESYVALVRGLCPPFGTVKRPLREGAERLEARTRFRRTRGVGGHSLIVATPTTGRNHQVRRHLAMLGHPVVGDVRYGDGATNRHFFEAHGLDRPFLHRARLQLPDSPAGPLTFEAPLAPDLEASLRSIERTAAGAAERGVSTPQPAPP